MFVQANLTGWRWEPIEARLPYVAATFRVDVTLVAREIGWFKQKLTYSLYGQPNFINLLLMYLRGSKRWLRDL